MTLRHIWPAYTGDEPRTRMFWPEGYGEWESVKSAESMYEGHKWPRKPLWGYVNEANPDVMQMQIDCAVKHGVNVFIYDWYWYDNRPFLENCLNDGFLKAPNNDKMKFYLMWANHDVPHLWSIDTSDEIGWNDIIWNGFVARDIFDNLVSMWITKYFSHPSYYKIDGKPVFMIYDVANFIKGVGGISEAKAALGYFREKVKEAGFPDLHLQIVLWNLATRDYSGVGGSSVNIKSLYESLELDSMSHYQWVSFTRPREYTEMMASAEAEYNKISETGMTYFPHVAVGWDNNPRYKKYRDNVAVNNSPDNFETALRTAKKYVDEHYLPAPLITINSWNEWTETSYLQPDELNGYGYLERIKKVFVDE